MMCSITAMYAILMSMFVPAMIPFTNGVVAHECSPTSEELAQLHKDWKSSQRGEMYRAFKLD